MSAVSRAAGCEVQLGDRQRRPQPDAETSVVRADSALVVPGTRIVLRTGAWPE